MSDDNWNDASVLDNSLLITIHIILYLFFFFFLLFFENFFSNQYRLGIIYEIELCIDFLESYNKIVRWKIRISTSLEYYSKSLMRCFEALQWKTKISIHLCTKCRLFQKLNIYEMKTKYIQFWMGFWTIALKNKSFNIVRKSWWIVVEIVMAELRHRNGR